MELSIEELRLHNTCPLLYEQREFYHQKSSKSRVIFRELRSVFNNVFYQIMHGRKVNPDRVTAYWKETMSKAIAADPDLTEKDFEFPAQCLAYFMDIYEQETEDRRDPSLEIIGPGIPFSIPISPQTIVNDYFHLLTKGRFGANIVLFEFLPNSLPDVRYANDFFYSVYSAAYRREFGHEEFCTRIWNLGDGRKVELIREQATQDGHLNTLRKLGEVVSSGMGVPNLTYCPMCSIAAPCHARMCVGRV